MKTKFFTLLLLMTISYGFSQKKINTPVNKPSWMIDRIEFHEKELGLKLSLKGIKYVQEDLRKHSRVIAKMVNKIYVKKLGGSPFNEDCLAGQVYWHVIFYDLDKPENSNIDNYGVLKHSKEAREFRKKYEDKGIKLKDVALTKFGVISNSRTRSIEVNYYELYLDGCKQLGKYTIFPILIAEFDKRLNGNRLRN